MIENFINFLNKAHKTKIQIIRSYWWLILILMLVMLTFPLWAKYVI